MDFNERWNWLLHGRKKYPWGESIGLSRGTIEKMGVAGTVPTWATIRSIRLAENINPEWFVDGVGSPYLVRWLFDEDFQELADALKVRQASALLMTDGTHLAVCVYLPKTFMTDPRQGESRLVEYTGVELICGLSPGMISGFSKINLWNLTYLEVTPKIMRTLRTGQMGTYQLLHAPDAAIKSSYAISCEDCLRLAEPVTSYTVTGPNDHRAVAAYLSLKPDLRLHVDKLIEALAKVK